MTSFPDDRDLTPEERRIAREEFIEIAQREQIAEGDITVSETIDGEDPTPDLDDRETEEEVWGEDDLVVKDEDRLNLSMDRDDDYLDEEDHDGIIVDDNNSGYVLTAGGYEALQARLADYRERLEERMDEMENVQSIVDEHFPEKAAEYEVRTRRQFLEERIEHLELILKDARVIHEDPNPQTVDIGDHVTLWNSTEEKTDEYDLLGTAEVQYGREGITVDSPVGEALNGAKKGDVVTIETPDGLVTYIVRDIRRSSKA